MPVRTHTLWIHAASLGEMAVVKALSPNLLPPVCITSDTLSGLEAARLICTKRVGFICCLRPRSTPKEMARFLYDLKISTLALVESVHLPVAVWAARRSGVFVVRVSATAGRGTRRGGLVWARASACDQVFAQNNQAAEFYRQTCERVVVCEDLKAAVVPAPPAPWLPPRPYWVAMSWRRSIQQLLNVESAPSLLIICPRDLNEAPQMREEALEAGRTVTLYSEGGRGGSEQVLIVNTFGQQSAVVAGASLAILGGSFDKGAHSPWDATLAGVPLITGPVTKNNTEALRAVPHHRCESLQQLNESVERALNAPKPSFEVPDLKEVTAALNNKNRTYCPVARPFLSPLRKPLMLLMKAQRHLRANRERPKRHPIVIQITSPDCAGPGKTTAAMYLAHQFRHLGHRVGVSCHSKAKDEQLLFVNAGFVVCGSSNRALACGELEEKGCTLVVVDDGYQQTQLHADFVVHIEDGRRPAAAGALPAGNHRGATSCDERWWVHEVPPNRTGRLVTTTSYWRGGRRPTGPVWVVVGLAQVTDVLFGLDVPVQGFLRVGNHRPLSANELRVLRKKQTEIVCTAKDLWRLPSSLQPFVLEKRLHLTRPPWIDHFKPTDLKATP